MEPTQPTVRWKVMDVAFGDNIRKPRRLILEARSPGLDYYTTCSESGGVGSLPESSLRTQDEWLGWVEKFADDLTGRELREAKEAVLAPFVEPECWAAFRKRYAETGDPWLKD